MANKVSPTNIKAFKKETAITIISIVEKMSEKSQEELQMF